MEVEGLWFSVLTSFILKMLLTTAPRRWSKELTRLYSRLLFLEATWITKTKNKQKNKPTFHTTSFCYEQETIFCPFRKSPCFASLIHPVRLPIPFNCSLNFPDTHLRFISTWHLNSHDLFWIFILHLYIFYIFSTSDNKAFNKNRSL